jgi:hypothetical protein
MPTPKLFPGIKIMEASIAKTECFNCHAKETPYNLIKLSEYDKNPVCSLCFNHQCSQCGCFSEEDDPTDEEFCWFAGSLYCQECSVSYICNQCGGGCNYPCPSCNRAHDNECQCEIECSECGELFNYDGNLMWDRFHSEKWSEDVTQICEDCWEEYESS